MEPSRPIESLPMEPSIAEPSQSPTPNESPVLKGRKGIAASGGKSWSEDEEVYLLQMRLQKVAYKIIAARLEKTELACRLHYHQLSHGGKNRKRANSFSSSDSSSISPNVSYSAPQRPRTPLRSVAKPSASGFQALNSPSPPAEQQILGPLLPSKHKRLKTSVEIDRFKLEKVVLEHTQKMWNDIAIEYGEGFSAEALEKAWKKKDRKRLSATSVASFVNSTGSPQAGELLPPLRDCSRSPSVITVDTRNEYQMAPANTLAPIGSPYTDAPRTAFPPMNPPAPVGSPYSTPKTEVDGDEENVVFGPAPPTAEAPVKVDLPMQNA